MSQPNRPGPRPTNEYDAALDAAIAPAPPPPPAVALPLKKQWDDDLEAELEAAMAGFDASALEVGSTGPRTRAADRAHAPQGSRGQETGATGLRPGKVIGVRGKTVFVDMGGKSEGVVPLEHFGEKVPAAGETIEVVVDRFDPAEGLLLLSLKGAAVEANWENVHRGMIVEARATKSNKGGLEVDVDGIRGFLPISQIDVVRVENANDYLNQKFKVVVTEANARQKNLVVSRREWIERERAEQRERTWAEIEEGQVREGTVRSIKDFGAFVDLGGLDGLLHIADMSWTRPSDIGQLVRIGDKLQVKVLKIDRETKKIGLGLKQLVPSPWDSVEDRFSRGQTVRGKVTRLMDFGAFVELEPGLEGLIHISELGPKKVFRVKDVVQPDQEVDVRILKIEPEAKRISLSLRPLPAAVVAEPEVDEDDTPPAPKPERKVPLKGGLGDSDPDPFG